MAREPLETPPHKTSGSAEGAAAEGRRPFGQREAHVPPIDELAASDRGYRNELAYLMSVISAWSYSDEQVLAAKLRYYGMPNAHIRRVTVQNNALLVATTAYLIQSPSGKTAVLAFRGTDPANIITILTDTQVMLQPFFGSYVHSGFHASVEVVWDDVDALLNLARKGVHLDDDDKEMALGSPLEALYITGHSLGGAMAVLAAARLSRDDYLPLVPPELLKGVYTFGQPMVGDHDFAKFCLSTFGSKLHRHVYHEDVVPQVPPRSNLAYAHIGKEWRSNALNKAWTLSDKASERVPLGRALALVAVNAIEARVSAHDSFRGPSIDDHMPPSYVEVSRYSVNPDPTREVRQHATLIARALGSLSSSVSNVSNRLLGGTPSRAT